MQMSMMEEFKKFALKGNVVDLAVGVIIGAAFGKIVSSLVDNIITPPLGLVIGGVDFSQLKLVLERAREGQPEVAIGYGIFIQQCFNFLIVAFALFFLIKVMNKLERKKHEAPPAPAATPEDVLLLREIRDSLRK
jgi:large conductance mechanosensitive channel